MAYLGSHGVLAHLGSLLQPRAINPHATLIMLFMNAVHEMITEEDKIREFIASFRTIEKYLRLPPARPLDSEHDPAAILVGCARIMFYNTDLFFDR